MCRKWSGRNMFALTSVLDFNAIHLFPLPLPELPRRGRWNTTPDCCLEEEDTRIFSLRSNSLSISLSLSLRWCVLCMSSVWVLNFKQSGFFLQDLIVAKLILFQITWYEKLKLLFKYLTKYNNDKMLYSYKLLFKYLSASYNLLLYIKLGLFMYSTFLLS